MMTRLRLTITALILILITALNSVWDTPVFASQPSGDIPDSEARTVTVGFSQIPGICEVDEYGKRSGLLIDYLNEIAKYNNWDYEYIEHDGEILYSEFMNGRFDLIGGAFYLPGLEAYADYPKYSIGNSRAVLLCRKDNPDIKSYELNTLNGKIIGVYGQAKDKIGRLKDYLQLSNIQCGIHYYSTEDMGAEGNLYHFLENGEVDLLLGNDSEISSGFRIAAEFPAQPYYIVARKGDSEILQGLNFGLEKLLDSEPNFSEERYEKNFQNVDITRIQMSKEELDYIADKKTVTVAAVAGWHPFYCVDNTLDHHNGILPDLLDNIADFSGLSFEYIFTDTYAEAMELIKSRKADILGYYLDTEDAAIEDGLALSRAYIKLNSIIVKNKYTNYPSKNLTAGILNGRFLPDGVSAKNVLYYDSIKDCLDAVNRGEVDFMYGFSSSIEQEMQNHRYLNVVPLSSINNSSEVAFAMDRPINPNLLTILNKSIGNMSADERNSLTERNMVSISYSSMTLSELIYANPLAFIAISSAFVLMAACSLLMIMRARLKNSIIQNELDKAELKSRAKGEFLSRMSHEIRTPMNAIMGLTSLTCMEKNLPAPVEANLKKIQASSQYLLALINDILDMSRIENGKLQIEKEDFSLYHLLADLETMIRPQAETKQIDFVEDFDIAHPCITGDPVRLRQVLLNLLSNALKFTPKNGCVTLTIHETHADGHTAQFLFSVKDNGIGIAPENQACIFDSFEQLGTSSSKSEGTGLGLPISSNIVCAMGGDLQVRSSPGHGSEFFFSLRFPTAAMKEEPEAISPAAPDDKSPEDLNGMRILLAEDNDLNAEIALELLQLQGAQADRAANGQEALDCFTASPPGYYQVILMDIRMPVMDGLKATQLIRASSHPDSSAIPIIAMTANSFREDSDAAYRAGMTGFVSKPVDFGKLFGELKKNTHRGPRNV